MNAPQISQRLNIEGNLTKTHVHLPKNETMKGLCPYCVTLKDLKQIASFLFELLKFSQMKLEHLEHMKKIVVKNLIGHQFTMVDHKHQTLQA
jgi:hypothetical protein